MSVQISQLCVQSYTDQIQIFKSADSYSNCSLSVENFRAQKGEPIQIKTPNPFSYEMEDTWTPYVTRQSTVISPVQRAGSKSPVAVPFSPRRHQKPCNSPDLTLYPVKEGYMLPPSPSPRYGTGLGGSRGFINYV